MLGLGLGFPGTVLKLRWTAAWVATLPSSTPVLFADAYDTYVQRPLRVSDLPPPGVVLFGADRACAPETCAGPVSRNPRRFLNAGTYRAGVGISAR